MNRSQPTALIAEDEPLLARSLQAELARAWPELRVVAVVGDGAAAVASALKLRPDLLFLDIRMPGVSGLEAAAELADRWPDGQAFPSLVFVTAYDQYAVQAFEQQAVDYLLKPVQSERLQKTVGRLQALLAARGTAGSGEASSLELAVTQLRQLLAPAITAASGAAAPLTVIQASVAGSSGQTLRMVPLDEVIYFEAADKYVRVLTAEREYLIRTPLKDLLPQLDANQFWQVHRGTLVRPTAIETVQRDEAGRLSIGLRQRKERLAVSRLYAHLFRAM